LAAIWKLPVLFVCENNQYATEVPFEYSAGNPNVAERGKTYGMPGVAVDGNDVEAVYQQAGDAVQRARSGGGPTLLECRTYRTRPHAEGMGDFSYRSREEVEEWKTRCPIRKCGMRISECGIKAENLREIELEIAAMVKDAHDFAESSPWPDPATATEHVIS